MKEVATRFGSLPPRPPRADLILSCRRLFWQRHRLPGRWLACSEPQPTVMARDGKRWLLAGAVVMLAAAAGRCIGLVMDGFATESLGAMLFELFLVLVFVLAYKKGFTDFENN